MKGFLMKGALLVSIFALFVGMLTAAPVKLKHWVWLDNPNDPTFSNMVKEFNSTHPGIQVELEVIGWSDFHTKMLTSAVGGGLPDSAAFKLTWIPEFTGMNALEPVDGYMNAWTGKADILPSLWNVYRVSEDKKLYVMPWEVQVLYMYYRPSLFKQANVNIPKTWDEFLTVAQKLTIDKNKDGKIDQFGFGMRGARYGHEPWGSFVFSNVQGNKIMENGKVFFDTPDAKKMNQLFIDLYRKYKVVPATAPRDGFAEIIANFKSGRTAMVVHHIKSAPDMVKTFGDDISAFPMPTGKYGRWTSMGDTENVIFKNGKHKKEAFIFISWLAEKQQIDKWCRATGSVPVCKSVQALPHYQQDRFMKVSFQSLPDAHVYPVTVKMGEWIESTWPAVTQQALENTVTPDQMITILANAMAKK
jgi:multiple sugar transport system substrate-binding protein